MNVKIIGAGSVGNHLAQASRRMGWDVTVTDADPKALVRMREEIYPKRYGAWDENIALFQSGEEPRGGYDIIMIGTPPDVRIPLAIEALKEKPRILHLEKPLCGIEKAFHHVSSFEEALIDYKEEITLEYLSSPEYISCQDSSQVRDIPDDLFVTVGYNHAVSESIQKVVELLKQNLFGEILAIDVEFREHWSGIFSAHPWLSGPKDSYLGHWRRGGGAGGEHSHALHLFLYLAHVVGRGDVKENVRTLFSFRKDGEAEYDETAHFLLETEHGLVGRVTQDVITFPPEKRLKILGEKGYISWICGASGKGDIVYYSSNDFMDSQTFFFRKTRSDDFYQEMLHYNDLLSGKITYENSPLNMRFGAETMGILYEAHGGRRLF
ncbi:MAG: Gfo/Idh/MocA family oxidoreductase [Candidatus Colwellbacteria bacterium]|nr:Gfo/Idh/MocA family oxidoreductase [Candidatus Colwellbacteria bacterium]